MTKKDNPTSPTEYSDQIDTYLQNVNKLYLSGKATEHSYRSDLQVLLSVLLTDCQITNEPKRIDCGAPDYIITRKDIPMGYIEAKDIGMDLTGKSLKEQFDRYKSALDNLIFTDYLYFRFFQKSALVVEIRIGTIENGHIKPLPENFEQFSRLIESFAQRITQSIKSPQKLAEMMANKAKMLANIISGALKSDIENEADSSLNQQMLAFQKLLIHDIHSDDFADIYAQTIAYGMFAARFHDPTLKDFSRQEAAMLIPKSNPFLRKLFQYIAGFDIDDRIVWVVDELVNIFLATDVADIMRNFGKSTKMEDPVIHFYETFLAAYNPKLRKSRGVWYTPQPVVNFIVRAVDDILKTEFGLPQGLADTSKVSIPSPQGKEEIDVHKVQILDPATGTGTFLAEVIRHIHKKFQGQEGIWSQYVSKDLIPRLNGFELLMASYAMAHLKLDILFTDTGYKPTQDQRFRIYLTNSLEEHHEYAGTLFAQWLSNEANQASIIKRDIPVMVVLGNPPYSVSSSNKSAWIQNLIADYKKNLNERKLNLDDDYIKFIRFGQHFIDKNGDGILAYISNNSFIDGITHRQMRKHLMESFHKIYILDLHGSSKKKETAPDGSPDQNVFDIMQGVSINIFIKTGKKRKKQLSDVFHFDLFGRREFKYDTLSSKSLKEIDWKKLDCNGPYYFFVKKDFNSKTIYDKGFKIDNLFCLKNSGVKTDRDSLFIDFCEADLTARLNILLSGTYSNNFKEKYRVKKSGSYDIERKLKGKLYQEESFQKIQYRPFDYRFIYYDHTLISRSAYKVMKHLLKGENIGLISCRQQSTFDFQHILISKILVDICSVSLQTKETGYAFPLYLYPDNKDQNALIEVEDRTPNLDPKIVQQIADILGMTFTFEKEITEDTFSPIDILDYIYAVLHNPNYREKYKEFLKIDFPRVPYPKNAGTFWQLVALGGELRQIHLLESPKVEQFITQYPVDGNNVVNKPKYKDNNVFINDTQYFASVPQIAWEFYIGGYQPAQKWLKDRKGRELSYEDIFHYQKIIVALTETSRLMAEIDKIKIE
jgi:predicted helicase